MRLIILLLFLFLTSSILVYASSLQIISITGSFSSFIDSLSFTFKDSNVVHFGSIGSISRTEMIQPHEVVWNVTVWNQVVSNVDRLFDRLEFPFERILEEC